MESKIGSISFFDYEKGIGLISAGSDGKELFVHFSSIRNFNPSSLKIGQKVSYIEYKGSKGPQAEYVVLL
ncbi:cold-shock protein [Priestia megaterium]|uniref:cold-shock protein n=1 Tax=Priestia megaterium TaxID=1404 RepID=UPI0018CF641D|nr:cold shock domain-containing protein [Priestia megaterium]MBG9472148.1 hypothetical protein [Priestia megaterium]MDD9793533.1 cold shock domain-containing protein [Priestia megaterium]